MRNVIIILLGLSFLPLCAFQISGSPRAWSLDDFTGFDPIGDNTQPLGDMTSCFVHQDESTIILRLNFDDMTTYRMNTVILDRYSSEQITCAITVRKSIDQKILFHSQIPLNLNSFEDISIKSLRSTQFEMLECQFSIPQNIDKRLLQFDIQTIYKGQVADEILTSGNPSRSTGNTAFVHHGNQGLTYTEVFYGSDPVSESGFDEVLQVHEATNLPGNFHMSGTLMPAAQWHNPSFNTWLRTLAANGKACMMTSALGQQIMPFLNNTMNNWSVQTESDMVNYRYNYVPHIAWVPERVWLAPSSYPAAGVIDWLGDNWAQHGVEAIILDDSPHLNGYDNRKIHWMNNGSGVTLRVIPINNTFVGQVMYDAQAAKNTIQNTTQYGIAVYGTDWEVIAEMNEHHNTSYLDNYSNIMTFCANNYPAIAVWKLDAALSNADFNGIGAELTTGTYGMLGGQDGYGGSNNSWYVDWAGTASHSDYHSTPWNYGYIWNNVYEHLMSVPDNNLSQLGWYTLMINLHETGWHDTGVSGWEHRYSSHMKNANVYAEGARWAAGLYTAGANAIANDIDRDGITETVIYNDQTFSVFENNGGRAAWIFSKDSNGAAHSLVGSDMAYWSETDGDYNESSNNHFAALSEVSPNYQNDAYNITINQANGTYVQVTMTKNDVTKVIKLNSDTDFLDIQYTFPGWGFVKSGLTPDLLDILWNGKDHLQRMWGFNGSYCGQRNSLSGATVAIVLGNGGGLHNGEFEGTLVKGDEIKGMGSYNIRLFAGYTSTPYDANQNQVIELDQIASDLSDYTAPQVVNQRAAIVGDNKLEIVFNESMNVTSATNISNYTLNGVTGNSIIQAYLTHDRRVILKLQNTILPNQTGTVLITSVTDLAGNAIESPNNTATLTTIIIPHLVGTFNNWVPTNHDHNFVLQDNGEWKATVSLSAGTHPYKVLESDSWNNNDWPALDQTITLTTDQDVTFFANCGVYTGARNGDEFIFNTPNLPLVTGSFLSELGDTDWSLSTNLSLMHDDGLNGDMDADDGVYSWEQTIPGGSYQYKIVLNRVWDQNTSPANNSIILAGRSTVRFTYDMRQNRIAYEITVGNADHTSPALELAVLKANYPNPFNPNTVMSFDLKKAADVKLNIYNTKGQLVKTLVSDKLPGGTHTYQWNGKNTSDDIVSSGVYLYSLHVNGCVVSTRKCILLK